MFTEFLAKVAPSHRKPLRPFERNFRSKKSCFRHALACSLIFISIFAHSPSPALALDALILQSKNTAVYEQVSRQINKAIRVQFKLLSQPGKGIGNVVTRSIVQDGATSELVWAEFGNPDITYAIGTKAFKKLLSSGIRPIVHVLAQHSGETANGVAGISLVAAPDSWFEATSRLNPQPTRIGVISSEDWGESWILKVNNLKEKYGTALFVRNGKSPKDVPKMLSDLRGKIDVLWVPPVPSLLSKNSLQAILTFSLDTQVPVVSYSSRLLKAGVAMAVVPDLDALSAQAVKIGLRMSEFPSAKPVPVEYPEKYRIEVNPTVLKNLELKISDGGPR